MSGFFKIKRVGMELIYGALASTWVFPDVERPFAGSPTRQVLGAKAISMKMNNVKPIFAFSKLD